MAKLIVKMSMSLDGYVQSSDGNEGWITAGRSADSGAWLLETVSNASAHLVGAATYTSWSTFWPDATGPVADAMNTIPKVVFSNSLTSTEWGPAEVVSGDLAENVARLKQERGDGYLLAQAGTRLVRSLVKTGLVDEYRLVVHPVILGSGERIFDSPLTLEPTSTIAFSGGIVVHAFAAAAEARRP